MTDTVLLFSYGTLQLESLQRRQFGRLLVGHADALPGHARTQVEITDPDVLAASGERFHPTVAPSDNPADAVHGMVFEITPAELAAADAYEVDDDVRVQVTLRSGARAWVYVRA